MSIFQDMLADDDEEIENYITKNLIISFDKKKENISFSSIKLINFFFKPLKSNIDTLIFCAFFANHFDFFHSYSYYLSSCITSKYYDESSIGDLDNFSLKDTNFQSFTPVLYYKNECLLNINVFIEFMSSISSKESQQRKLVEQEEDINNSFLIINALIELIELAGSIYYHNFMLIKNEEQIRDTIENDYNSTYIPCFYIFQVDEDTDIPYRINVEFCISKFCQFTKEFNFRIVWCIFEDKLIYIDEDEITYEFNFNERSFIRQGKNKVLSFQNSIFVCYSLEMEKELELELEDDDDDDDKD